MTVGEGSRADAGRDVPPGARRGLVLAGIALAILAGAVAPLQAYIQTNLVDGGQPDVGLFQSGTFTLRIEQDASFRITDGTDLTALNAALQRWTDVTTSSIVASPGAAFDIPSPVDAGAGLGTAGNRLVFAETDNSNHIGNAIAVAFYSFASDGHILDCDIVMNERLYTFSTSTPANPNMILGSSTYDIGEIATHEIGHCLGMAHSPVAGRFSATTGLQVSGFTSSDFALQATLYPYGSRTIQGRSLADDDIAGVSFIYPNSTLTTTKATISGRVLDGASFTSIKGAHVVAVSTAAPDVPILGAVSGLQAGGPGGEFTLVGLAPGSYYLRLEPLVGTSNPFTEGNTPFTDFVTSFPWEYWDGVSESGFDSQTARTAITVVAAQTVSNVNIFTNVGAPDPQEPNNTRATASALSCETQRQGSIVPLNDIDYYVITITQATEVTIDLNASRSGSPLDAVAAVMDSGGGIVASADNVLSLDPFLDVDLLQPGTYYVAIASVGDEDFDGSGGQTAGSYTLNFTCGLPDVPDNLCRSHVLYAGDGTGGSLMAIADADGDLSYDGFATLYPILGTGQGQMITRADGGVVTAVQDGTLRGVWDDNHDFVGDRVLSLATGLNDGYALAGYQRGGAELFYAADLFNGGSVKEYVETTGDMTPEATHLFTTEPETVLSLAVDEAGIVYVLDINYNGGEAAIRAYRDLDGDGDADTSSIFMTPAGNLAGLAARGPGEVFATDLGLGQIDRFIDRNLDGVADSSTTYVSGLALDIFDGLVFDRNDTLYTVEGGNRVLAIPDGNHDGVLDSINQFSPLLSSIDGLAFGASPPGEVSLPRSRKPLTVVRVGTALRVTWEDQGPTTLGYNLYQGTVALGSGAVPTALLCGIAGTPDGAGGRYVDLDPAPAGDLFFLVSASDACGEGTTGRRSSLGQRPAPNGACGP
ncbi:MAG TPA: hypothetical protein VJV75_04610 [Candidatus Polarisedimenticolia bacterium]|nr:hypothetical protein [Candidatus Polarisedimenticolia bacterium]